MSRKSRVVPLILTILGSVATVAAVVLAAKEGPKFKAVLESDELTTKEKVLAGAKIFGIAGGCAAVSLGCQIGAHCMDMQTQASLMGAGIAARELLKKYHITNGKVNGKEAVDKVLAVIDESKKDVLPQVMRDENGEKLHMIHLSRLYEGFEPMTFTSTKFDVLKKVIRIETLLDICGDITANGVLGIFDLEQVDEGGHGWSFDMLWDGHLSRIDFAIDDHNDGNIFVYPKNPASENFTEYNQQLNQ